MNRYNDNAFCLELLQLPLIDISRAGVFFSSSSLATEIGVSREEFLVYMT